MVHINFHQIDIYIGRRNSCIITFFYNQNKIYKKIEISKKLIKTFVCFHIIFLICFKLLISDACAYIQTVWHKKYNCWEETCFNFRTKKYYHFVFGEDFFPLVRIEIFFKKIERAWLTNYYWTWYCASKMTGQCFNAWVYTHSFKACCLRRMNSQHLHLISH